MAAPEVHNNGVQLLQNRPNPFRGQTTIAFVLPEACEVRLRISDFGSWIGQRTQSKIQIPKSKIILNALYLRQPL